MREIFFLTKDNVKIAANYYENGFSSLVIIAPGWFMTKDSKPFFSMSQNFNEYFDVITFDFRGHGKSGGRFTFTSKEILDMQVILNFAKENYKKIFLIGFSLGAATSAIAASINQDIDKLILVSVPCDFNRIENHWWKKEAWLPTLKKCEPKVWLSIRPGNFTGKKIKPIDIITKITCPTLFIAGDKDATVCPWHTKTLFDKAVCEKKFIEIENSCHAEDLYLKNNKEFINLCLSWFK